ncbi:autotransporter outer membrane beta-barrel domain-containing protein [Bartonella rattimassiliensis]|uniref:Outer membrane autotransporter barrel domain-containing protein n=1 Tax=Bartonella rattimassiliensis 15908 TaxID=1094556 RepID=J0ZAT9_9HYPH|nr:autotransporter outer membrane beta-barrel domain-containing protein [Bartonella rattimassiliensis]EJF84943.1 outer membrane autotransporter barrel domain-containing protein [Bartonella rattimassiliensis 15908]
MIKVLKRHIYLYALTTSVLFFVHNIDANAQEELSCSSLLKSSSCDVLEKRNDLDTIGSDFSGVTKVKKFDQTNIKVGEKGSLGVEGTLELKNTGKILSEVFAQEKMKIVLDKISIIGSGKNTVNDQNINGFNQAVFGVKQGGFLLVKDGKINVSNIYGLVVESSEGVFIPGGTTRYGVLDDDSLYGSWDWRYSGVVFENSDITLNGRSTRGIYLKGGLLQEEYIEGEMLSALGEVQFKKTNFKVPNGTAIYIDDAKRFPHITALEGSRIFANRFLDVKVNSHVAVEADASFFVGGARVDKKSYAEVELSNKSQWTVTPGKNNKWHSSSVSFVRVMDSSIVFQKPKDVHYQTLHIGKFDDDHGLDYVYVANDARLLINASLDIKDGQVREIEADKLLIYGNIYGKTKVYIVEVPADVRKGESRKDTQGNNKSVSIIQVYGKAAEDSFKLAAGYVALRGVPYRYSLRAYGPTSSLGKAKDENKLAKGKKRKGDFWDYRLEAEYVQHSSRRIHTQLKDGAPRRRVSRSLSTRDHHDNVVASHDASVLYHEEGVKAVVPQVPTYLLMPNALFQVGLMDMSNHNKQLGTLRTAIGTLGESGKSSAIFARGYGGSYRYLSDLSALEYGYGGNLNYNAIEASILLNAIEDAHHTLSFGVMGSYGKIVLQPQDVEESKKSVFDKWAITAYAGIQHDTGFYIDGLFSYGLFKGDVLTKARGKTTTLKATPLNASWIAGKSFMIGQYKGLIFDPQIQVVYQSVPFDKTSDIDGFDVGMGKVDQWVVRVGGNLSKTLVASEEGHVVSFKGKLHLTNGFREKQRVQFGDEFQLGAFGSSLETGMGVSAQLSSNLMLHGDVIYQHRLSKSGFSGTIFSGGLRYRF